MMEQDAGLLHRMTYLGSVYEAVQRVSQLKGEAIHNINASDGRIIKRLMDEGLYF